MEEALKALNIKRGRIKKSLTDFQKYVKSLEATRPITKEDNTKLELKLNRFTPKLDEFESVNYEICDAQGSDDDEGELEQFEKSYYEAVAAAQGLIEEYSAFLDQDTKSVTNFETASSVHGGEDYQKIKLPRVTLPTFSGDSERWLDFKDLFNSMVHEDNSLSEAQKLYYLRGALEGEAARVAQGFKAAAQNYDVLWKCLCERYEDDNMLVHDHLSALFNLKPIKYECPKLLHEMMDKINIHLRALESLEEPVQHWDTILIFWFSKKLDAVSLRKWEEKNDGVTSPTMEDFRTFLRKRANKLKLIDKKAETKTADVNSKYTTNTRTKDKTFKVTTSNLKCYLCQKDHAIYYCEDFKALSVEDRITKAIELKLCKNCLRPGHYPKDCARSGCKNCNLKHNTLLHRAKVSTETADRDPGSHIVMHASTKTRSHRVLLATIMANVESKNTLHEVRLLLDNGSQLNLVTVETTKRLGLQINKSANQIGGIGDCTTQVLGSCRIKLKSKLSNFQLEIECFVLPEISHNLPQFDINKNMIRIPKGIQLADPSFSNSKPVDILLGAGHFFNILSGNTCKLGKNLPILAETEFGWIISGLVPTNNSYENLQRCYVTQDIQDCLAKFWEIENTSSEAILSEEENFAESHFRDNTTRNSDGRFVVAIPFKESLDMLGNSQVSAQKRFLSLERRLQTNSELQVQYHQFMSQYKDLNHMTIYSSNVNDIPHYVLPHHGVLNCASTTTKMRVVFDGSHSTDSGYSRNQIECIGPVVQSDLVSILLRFRCHKIAISTDIVKMYRQILVRPEDRNMQLIYWRDHPSHSLQLYQLNTVTYGTSSGSFLSTRCLVEIANLVKAKDSQLHLILKNDTYVDDILTGVDSPEEGKLLCSRLNNTLNKFCFPLQKWNSNCPDVLSEVLSIEGQEKVVPIGSTERTKTLGVFWQPRDDTLSYAVSVPSLTFPITKRSILSAIGQIFDPLGLVGACIILPKILLQSLWELKLDWDSPVPDDIRIRWVTFQENLLELNKIQIPRNIMPEIADNLELHGFADASESAYGACVYLRSSLSNNKYVCSLMCAKSKVAPIKTLTIPRLELCAALVLAKLIDKVISSFRFPISKVYLWTDSEIVLCWLKKPSNLLKIFVANRVSQIQDLTEKFTWSHVSSSDNPADLISRGVMPNEISNCRLWWQGPPWLSDDINRWPTLKSDFILNQLPEVRKITAQVFTTKDLEEFIDLSRFSNYHRLLNTVTYVLRFISRLKGNPNKATVLLPQELSNAQNVLIKVAQSTAFQGEIYDLAKKGRVKPSSTISSLCPFLDEDGILRVSGRLQNSFLNFGAQHPIIMPRSHKLTKLIFRHEHVRLGHAGPQLLLNSIREKFWPLHGKALARATLHECVTCFKVQPKNNIPQMGVLPSARVTPSAPFSTVGIDYAGPILIKDRKGRGTKTSKAYFALFICFSTKAIHIEIVSDLTTQAFIASFRRFSSRRGKPHTVWSDNGTNFVGARNELKNIISALCTDDVSETFSIDNINWNFIPSNSPHFGGLWESGVRGVKFHLKRVIGNQLLTFEELYTVCCQIEAIVNSRPLTLLSNHPADPSPLTPGHFLIGRSITSLPDESLEEVPLPRLSRYQLLQQMTQQFWRRWSSEYLHTLQPRPKWKASGSSLSHGDVVLIRNDNSPPMHWPLGHIINLHPGKDGVARVATVKTSKGEIRRAVHKLFPLPIDSIDTSSTAPL